MAGQTVSNLTKVLKEVWTADTLAKQFYNDNPLLDRLEKTDRYTIGKEAEVPLHTGRGGATTVLGSAGGSLNPVDAQRVDRGTYNLAYNWAEIKLEAGAINQANGGATSVVDAVEFEVGGALDDLRKDITRQAVGNGDALIAQCTSGGASTTVNLLATGYGYEALVRGFLRIGQTVDVGTTSNETSLVADSPISAVSISSSSPTITIGTSITTTSSHYVSIANARSGSTSNEMAGFRQIYGSNTAVLGGLDPSTATYWKPSSVDTTTTVLSLDVPLSLQQAVFQTTGTFPTAALTGIKQITALYTILQNQVRFADDIVRAGNVMKVNWNGLSVEAIPDASDREFYLYDPSQLLIVTGQWSKPTWASDIEGAGGQLRWVQGATGFVDALTYPLGLACRRRNSGAAAVGLTA